jgi:hypothetical protein
MAIQKRVQIADTKSFTVRVDATNVFNHATPAVTGGFFAATGGAPELNMQGFTPFGAFNNKVGRRQFQLKARVDF